MSSCESQTIANFALQLIYLQTTSLLSNLETLSQTLEVPCFFSGVIRIKIENVSRWDFSIAMMKIKIVDIFPANYKPCFCSTQNKSLFAKTRPALSGSESSSVNRSLFYALNQKMQICSFITAAQRLVLCWCSLLLRWRFSNFQWGWVEFVGTFTKLVLRWQFSNFRFG